MAPTTRRQQKQRQSIEDESAAATETNVARINKATGKAKQNGHKRFDSEDEEEEETTAVSDGVALGEGKDVRNDSQEEGEEDDSDDDAPEAVTMGSGRVAAKKREEDAKKAIELQEKAARQKRKQREALLKEQKESAAKRRKLAPKATAESVSKSATEEKDDIEAEVSDDDDYETPAKQQLTVTSKSKAPDLLPTALLEKIADRLSSQPQRHKRTGDGSDEDDFRDDMDTDGLEDDMMLGGELSFGRTEKNRRKRAARKAKMEFKKGPVSVKVLKDDKKARKIMMPPANKRVANTKSTWLSGRGAVRRRSIGSVGGSFAK